MIHQFRRRDWLHAFHPVTFLRRLDGLLSVSLSFGDGLGPSYASVGDGLLFFDRSRLGNR